MVLHGEGLSNKELVLLEQEQPQNTNQYIGISPAPLQLMAKNIAELAFTDLVIFC